MFVSLTEELSRLPVSWRVPRIERCWLLVCFQRQFAFLFQHQQLHGQRGWGGGVWQGGGAATAWLRAAAACWTSRGQSHGDGAGAAACGSADLWTVPPPWRHSTRPGECCAHAGTDGYEGEMLASYGNLSGCGRGLCYGLGPEHCSCRNWGWTLFMQKWVRGRG